MNGLNGANGQIAQWHVAEELKNETGQLLRLLRMVVLSVQEVLMKLKSAT